MKNFYPVISKKFVTLFLFCFAVYCCQGQASLATSGVAVTETFTGYLGANATLANWTLNGNTTFNGTNQTAGTTGGWYGNNNVSFLGSGSANNGNATWKLQNNTGSTITSFDLSFVARMWRSQANSPIVTVTYATNSTGIVPATGPQTAITTFNDATSGIAAGVTLTANVSSISIPNGNFIYLRFIHGGNATSDNLGWDDVSITPTATAPTGTITLTPATQAQGPFCNNSTNNISLDFTKTGIVTSPFIQLSNAAGSFASGTTNLGGVMAASTITGTLPSGIAVSSLYKIRIVSTDATAIISADNASAFMVNAPPTIITNPSTATQTVCSGSALTALSVIASGSSPTYQWYSNTVPSNSGGTLIAVTSANLTPSNTLIGTTYYYCVVSGAAPCTSVTSNVSGAITINALPANPAGVISGITPSCGATILSYSAPAATAYWQTTALGTSTTNPTTGTITAASSGNYYVRIFNGTCWSASSTAAFPVTIVTAPAITTQPTSQSVSTPTTATFTVTASNAATYQWQVNTGSGFANVSTGTGGTTASYTTPATSIGMNGYVYKCIVTGNNPCSDVLLTNAASLNVSAGPCVSDASGYPTTAGNWILTGATVSNAQACSGNGLLFTANGHSVVTPSVLNPALLSFTKKRSGTAPSGWNMNIEIGTTATGPWTLVTNVNTITTTCASTTIDISSFTGTRYLKFTDLRSSGANQIGIDDIAITCNVSCTPTTTVTSFLPTSGPANTLVTIIGTGFLTTPITNAVKFSSVISPSYTIVSDTKIIAQVPASLPLSTSVSVANASNCFSNPLPTFTCIKNTGACITYMSDLIISEIYDPTSGNNHYIEIYNGTGAAIDLDGIGSDYELQVFTDPSTTVTFDISGIINAGQVLVFYGGANGGLATGTQSSVGRGYNENDFVRLLKNGSMIDVMNTPNYIGYTWRRLNTVTGPNATYTAAEWSTTSAETLVNIGLYTPLTATLQPGTNVSSVSCSPFSMSTTTTSTPVTYQWKFYNSTTNTWDNVLAAAITPATIPSNGVGSATSNTLNLGGDLTHLLNYQFYCQISGNAGACTSPTNAAQFTYPSKNIYRSKVLTGNWNLPSNWEMSDDGITWVPTCTYPKANNSDRVIIPQNSYIICNIDNDIDKIIIDNGGTLEISPTIQLRIYNTFTGPDLLVNGTLVDRSSTGNGIYLTAYGATWILGNLGTIIKTNTASINEYGIAYEGGISTIPASANWIYRYNGDGNLAVSSLGGVGGMFYPNLTYESVAGPYTPPSNFYWFTGASGYVTIKGDLSIGNNNPANAITMVNVNTNAQAMLVYKIFNINAGSTYTNVAGALRGTGVELKGYLKNSGTLTLNGSSFNTADPFGKLIFSSDVVNGLSIQGMDKNGTYNLEDLIINNDNTVPSGVSCNSNISIAGTLSFSSNNAKLIVESAKTITLKSNIDRTANVAAIPASNTITYNGAGASQGGISVERYLRGVKAWRLMATPVDIASSPSINESWRENEAIGTNTATGFGTRITGPVGMDEYTIRNSMKYYNMTSNNFTEIGGVDLANNTQIANEEGYFVFVRGDRGVDAYSGTIQTTNLRIRGKLRTGLQNFLVDANKFKSVGNPFASQIDIATAISSSNNLVQAFTIWNPQSAGSYNVGAYETYIRDIAPPYNFIQNGTNAVLNTIESGQAFFVQSYTGGTLSIDELHKANGSGTLVSRPSNAIVPTIAISLLTKNNVGQEYIADAVIANFDANFTNGIANEDVIRVANSFDNIAILQSGRLLAADRRNLPTETDTIHLQISSLRNANYTLDINPAVCNNIGLQAFLGDRFLQTTTTINLADTSLYNFTVTSDANSKAANRFYIVFKAVPTSIFANINAVRNADKTIAVKWIIQNETNTNNYELQHSNNGINFTTITTKNAVTNNNTSLVYAHNDAAATLNNNWYRIKINPTNGVSFYSGIAMVSKITEIGNNAEPQITIAPTVITNNQLSLSFSNQKLGVCAVAINNAMGQNIFTTSIKITTNNQQIKIDLPNNIAKGKYDCVLLREEGKIAIPFVVQ